MKYNSNNKPVVCMATKSSCYNGTTIGTPVGVLWHSTGCDNPWLKRYVQPSPNDPDREKLIKLIGKNTYGNDWNNHPVQAGLNAWIGKMADGRVSSVQTLPWDFRPWGCGSGKYGSCNGDKNVKNSPFWLQFEICQDSLRNRDYFEKVYKEGVELTAYWCKMFNLNPTGTVIYKGVKVPVILCHYDSHRLGLGSNHSDVEHWFKLYGKTMDDVRRDVAALMKEPKPTTSNCPSSITTLVEKGVIDSPDYWVQQYNNLEYLDSLLDKLAKSAGSKKVNNFTDVKTAINHLVKCNVINTPSYWMNNYSKIKYLDKLIIKAANNILFGYKVKVTANALNIRKGAGTNYAVRGTIKDKGVYTIVDEAMNGNTKWGLLTSYKDKRDGWISLKYCKKI